MERPLAFAVASSALVFGGLVASRATSDALFLAHFPATSLPAAMTASATLSILAVAAASRGFARIIPARLVPIAFAVSGALFVVEWALLPARPRLAVAVLYLHVTALGPLLVSGFWSVVNERFDPYTTKRSLPLLSAAAGLSGVVGAVTAERVATLAAVRWTLPLFCIVSLAAARTVRGIGLPAPETARAQSAFVGSSAPAFLRRHPLLGPMALLMLLVAAADSFLDYVFKVGAAATWRDARELVRFFAGFYVVCGLATVAIQAGLGSRILRRFGVAGAMALLPLGVTAVGTLAAGSGRFWAVAMVRGVETVLAGALFRPAFEVLYTPIPAAVKRPLKGWIDVVARRVGSLGGAGLVLFLVFVSANPGSALVLGLAIATSAFALVWIVRIHRAYVLHLGDSLRSGRLALDAEDVLDATTSRTVAETRVAYDRHALLEQVRAHAAREATRADAASRSDAPAPSPIGVDAPSDGASLPEAAQVRLADLASGDPARVRRALHAREAAGAVRSAALDRRLASHAIPLLARSALARDVEDFLQRVAPRCAGQLADALLDRAEAREVRFAVARLLGTLSDRRALDGLWAALDDPDFELRLACARAAVRVVERQPLLAPPKDAVHALVERELAAAAGAEAPPGELLAHVLSLLALVHGRATMNSALSGLRSGSAGLRGTALELLESVLPPGLRASTFGLIKRMEASGSPRPGSLERS